MKKKLGHDDGFNSLLDRAGTEDFDIPICTRSYAYLLADFERDALNPP